MYGCEQEHIELGRHTAAAVRAAVFGPAIADFDALLMLRRDALPSADRAAQGAKALADAARKRGFAPMEGSRSEQPDVRARAVLRAVPEGESPLVFEFLAHMLYKSVIFWCCRASFKTLLLAARQSG